MMMAKEISRLLAQRAEEIARHLLPNGKKESNEWRTGSVNGEAGHSLGVHLSGEKAGLWCDFSNAGDKGDLIDLWVHGQVEAIVNMKFCTNQDRKLPDIWMEVIDNFLLIKSSD